MGVVNKRNALLGWTVWKVGKRVAKRKAKAAVPSVDPETKRPNKSLVASLLGAAAGALWFLRRRRGDEEDLT
jgi:MYXO-CTERM domain-containing protein